MTGSATYPPSVLYLASRSPQRAMLLRRAHIDFQVVESACDEETVQHAHPQVLCLERARHKAGAAILPAHRQAPAVILGADTVVALGTTVFGSPRDRDDAVRILTSLQGTTHQVHTAHCCLLAGTSTAAARIAVARVTLRPMSKQDIAAYVGSGESDGRAGAYAIQETGDRYLANLEGSWDTVVGLNVAMVARLYQECCDRPLPGYTP